MKRFWVISLIVFLMLPLAAFDMTAAETTQRRTAQRPKTPLSPSQLIELKRFGAMIAQGKTVNEILNNWKSFVERSRTLDVDAAIGEVIREARSEAERNVQRSRSKVQFYEALRNEIRKELDHVRSARADYEKGTRTPLQRKIFELKPGTTGKVVTRPASVITERTDINRYIVELEAELRSVGDDTQLANIELQSALQKQQQTLQTLSSISNSLNDTAMNVTHKMGE